MTCAYVAFLVAATLVVVLLPWIGLAAVITGAALAATVEPYWVGLVVAGAGLAALFVGVLLRQRDAMATVRAGAWPALCGRDRRPRDHPAMLAAVAELSADGARFDVVGGGWTSWMNRRGAARPRLFTDKFHGYDAEKQLWRCGSTIYEMEAFYKQKGLAFPTFPTNGTIALGSWVACENHGNSGDKTGPSHAPFNRVVLLRRADAVFVTFTQRGANVVRQQDDAVVELGAGHPNPAARKLLQQNPHQYVVLYAGIDESKLIRIDDESTWLQYKMIEISAAPIPGQQQVADWLAPGAALRWLFVGSGRGHGVGVRMERLGNKPRPTHRPFPWCVERPHREPHFCSTSCRYFQTDPCSYVCGWHEPAENWNGYSDRLAANYWYPGMWWPSVTLGGVLLDVHNFEIIFVPPTPPLSGTWLHGVLRDLIELFETHRGRCEVRSSNASADAWVFLDCGIAGRWCAPQIFGEPFRILYEHGVRVVASHTGKYYPPAEFLSGTTSAAYQETHPGERAWSLRRVPAYELGRATENVV